MPDPCDHLGVQDDDGDWVCLSCALIDAWPHVPKPEGDPTPSLHVTTTYSEDAPLGLIVTVETVVM